jgi:hypothetical protein
MVIFGAPRWLTERRSRRRSLRAAVSRRRRTRRRFSDGSAHSSAPTRRRRAVPQKPVNTNRLLLSFWTSIWRRRKGRLPALPSAPGASAKRKVARVAECARRVGEKKVARVAECAWRVGEKKVAPAAECARRVGAVCPVAFRLRSARKGPFDRARPQVGAPEKKPSTDARMKDMTNP